MKLVREKPVPLELLKVILFYVFFVKNLPVSGNRLLVLKSEKIIAS